MLSGKAFLYNSIQVPFSDITVHCHWNWTFLFGADRYSILKQNLYKVYIIYNDVVNKMEQIYSFKCEKKNVE